MENRKGLLEKIFTSDYKWVIYVLIAAILIGIAMLLSDEYGDSGGEYVIGFAIVLLAFTVYKAWQSLDGKRR